MLYRVWLKLDKEVDSILVVADSKSEAKQSLQADCPSAQIGHIEKVS